LLEEFTSPEVFWALLAFLGGSDVLWCLLTCLAVTCCFLIVLNGMMKPYQTKALSKYSIEAREIS
jgi:cell division protein FtsW (lipid II flippase)